MLSGSSSLRIRMRPLTSWLDEEFWPKKNQPKVLLTVESRPSWGLLPVTWSIRFLLGIKIVSMMGNSEFSIITFPKGGFTYTERCSSISKKLKKGMDVKIQLVSKQSWKSKIGLLSSRLGYFCSVLCYQKLICLGKKERP